jgi:hypothetical protein
VDALITGVSQGLCYRVIFRRQEGDAWPDLVRGKIRWRITEVAVKVDVDGGRLRARRVEAICGRRVTAGGILGAALGKSGCPYGGAGAAGGQAAAFRRAAVATAGARLRGWLASFSAGRRAAMLEGRPMTDAERDAERYPGYAADLRLLRKAGMDQPGDYMAPDD